MDAEQVENLRKVYNEEHPSEPPIPKGTMTKVWNTIGDRMHSKCESATAECILAHMLKKQKAPSEWEKNPGEWLSSIDIDNVEKEYSHLFKTYKYLGTIPIDFGKTSKTGTCIINSLCSLKLSDIYRKGFKQVGIVFNTDVSTGPGQHWIALFADIHPKFDNARITYFDSYSKEPEPEIERLMFRWKEEWDALKIHANPTELTYNKTRHQYKDSECGMYCLLFHFCCLTGVPMDKEIPDDVIQGFRELLFIIGKK